MKQLPETLNLGKKAANLVMNINLSVYYTLKLADDSMSMEKINKSISFAKVEILSNGELIVDGGDGSGVGVGFGGGAGGVIQIISAMGNISAHSLSVQGGNDSRIGCNLEEKKRTAANGYYYLQGMRLKRSVKNAVTLCPGTNPFEVSQSLGILNTFHVVW